MVAALSPVEGGDTQDFAKLSPTPRPFEQPDEDVDGPWSKVVGEAEGSGEGSGLGGAGYMGNLAPLRVLDGRL